MRNEVKRINLITLIVTLTQLVLSGLFMLFYLLNLWDMQVSILPEYIAYGFTGLSFIDAVYVWIIIRRIYKFRQESDIQASFVIGKDVQEVYTFGEIGYILIDENKKVLWISDFLLNRNIRIIGENIFTWEPQLEKFENTDISVLDLKIEGFDYEIKYLRASGMFILRDQTKYFRLKKNYDEERLCIGIINIDNYNDLTATNDDYTQSINEIRQEINMYAKDKQFTLRQIRNDSYLVFCNFKTLTALKEDGFSILDKIRTFNFHEGVKATLSIGFAKGGNNSDYGKLNELAASALDHALSRGGDQAVIFDFEGTIEYFGGKSEAVESTNKVKIRSFSNTLLELIKKSYNVIIMGHIDTDMDALGACLGVKALAEYAGMNSYIVLNQQRCEQKTLDAATTTKTLDYDKIFVDPNTARSKLFKQRSLVILVDNSSPERSVAPNIIKDSDKVVVIDHHRIGPDYVKNPILSMIDTSASSASELVVEMLKYNSESLKINLKKDYATIMLSGILLDTKHFKTKTVGARTFEACMHLKLCGADNGRADDYLKDDIEDYLTINKFIEKRETPYYGVVICQGEEDTLYDTATLAKVGDQCMQLSGIQAAFVFAKTKNGIGISARSNGTINVQMLVEKMCDEGKGGGHFTAAGGICSENRLDNASNKIHEVLERNLDKARRAGLGGY